MSKKEHKNLSGWCETVKRKLDDRNEIVHGQPAMKDGEPTFRLYSGKHGMLGQAQAWPIDRVCDLRDFFIDADLEVDKKIRPLFETWIAKARDDAHSRFAYGRTPPEE